MEIFYGHESVFMSMNLKKSPLISEFMITESTNLINNILWLFVHVFGATAIMISQAVVGNLNPSKILRNKELLLHLVTMDISTL